MITSRMSLIARVACVALATAFVVGIVAEAEARAGRGFSSGSRGVNTPNAVPSTPTAPGTAKPMERSMQQPSAATAAKPGAAVAGQAAQAAKPSFGKLLMGGLLGAGLVGLLFGTGLLSFSGLAGFLGLLLQVALIGGIIWLVMALIRGRRQQPAMANAGAGLNRATSVPDTGSMARVGGGLGGGGSKVNIVGDDYSAFERLLGEIQEAYGREDTNALGDRATPEMLSYFAHELADNAKQGVRNELSGVKLLQGDLAEAWREASGEYATVAMRYQITDATVERASGRVVSGSRTPQEVTEVWTFVRRNGGSAQDWQLSAIQQTA